MFDIKKVNSLERLIKSLSLIKCDSFTFKDWLLLVNDAKDCASLINELRQMEKVNEKPPLAPEQPKLEVSELPIIEAIEKIEKRGRKKREVSV
jgi:hypothetical protein